MIMKKSMFESLCGNFKNIAIMNKPERDKNLNDLMCAGYLFLDLTEKQINTLKELLKAKFPDIYKEYDTPDEYGCKAEFKYLRFK